jgi:hypothetical protein
MSVSITVPARLLSLPDDVLRALATFMPLSDLLMLVQCSRQLHKVLQNQLNGRLDQLFVVTHDEEHWAQARQLPSMDLPEEPEQWLVEALFGEAKVRGARESKVYCFIDGQSFLSLTQYKHFFNENDDGYVPYYIITGKNKFVRDSFASWLRYREQRMATAAHGTSTDIIGGITNDL